jgi:hypothetical protein
MIIDKILAQVALISDNKQDTRYVQDGNYIRYTCDFDAKSGSLIISLQTIYNFEGDTLTDIVRYEKAMRADAYKKLLEELKNFLPNREINDDLVITDPDFRKLTIKPEAYKHIANYVKNYDDGTLADIGCEELPLAVRTVNALNASHPFESLDSSLIAYHEAVKRIAAENKSKAQTAGTTTYTSFCLSAQSPQNGSTVRSIEAVESEESDNDSERFYVSVKDVAKSLAVESPSSSSKDRPSVSDQVVELVIVNQNVNAAQNNAGQRIYKDKSQQVLGRLQERVYDRIRRDYNGCLPHGLKELNVKEMTAIIGTITDVEALSDIYHFINIEINKKILNVHENFVYDACLFKMHTNSWQELIADIRKKAFKVLLNKLGLGDNLLNKIINHGVTSNDDENPIVLPNPQKIIDTITPYLEDKLFCEHRSNNFFRNLFHSTTTVKNLLKILTVCEAQLKREKQPIFVQ